MNGKQGKIVRNRRVRNKGEKSRNSGGCRSVLEWTFGAEDRHIGRDWGSGSRRGLEVFASRGGDENIVGVNGDVLVKRGEEESIENFLGDLGGCRRHSRWREVVEMAPL